MAAAAVMIAAVLLIFILVLQGMWDGKEELWASNAIKEIVQKIIDSNPQQVEAYKDGKVQLFGFFVGQVMKETKGRANPQEVNKLLKELLG